MADNEKKILIDEDWKSRVQAEREELEKSRKRSQGDATGPSAAPAFPPASFEMHLSTLATEAMVALGSIPHPASGELEKNLEQAKYVIDTVDMIQEKTRGNLSDQESRAITDLLHQLRMLYVTVQSEEAQASE